MGYGLVGLLILVLDIYVICLILTGSGDSGMKLDGRSLCRFRDLLD
jgi:hypothetical protein